MSCDRRLNRPLGNHALTGGYAQKPMSTKSFEGA